VIELAVYVVELWWTCGSRGLDDMKVVIGILLDLDGTLAATLLTNAPKNVIVRRDMIRFLGADRKTSFQQHPIQSSVHVFKTCRQVKSSRNGYLKSRSGSCFGAKQ